MYACSITQNDLYLWYRGLIPHSCRQLVYVVVSRHFFFRARRFWAPYHDWFAKIRDSLFQWRHFQRARFGGILLDSGKYCAWERQSRQLSQMLCSGIWLISKKNSVTDCRTWCLNSLAKASHWKQASRSVSCQMTSLPEWLRIMHSSVFSSLMRLLGLSRFATAEVHRFLKRAMPTSTKGR